MLNGKTERIKYKLYYFGNCTDCSTEYRVRSDYKNTHMGYCRKCAYSHIEMGGHNKYIKNQNIYNRYNNMKSRCYNPNTENYSRYGGKGITICDEWLNSYSKFEEWSLNNGYMKNLTIERTNPKLGYSPDNCEWITLEENIRRSSTKVVLEDREYIRRNYKRGVVTMKMLGDKFGVTPQAIHYILKG